MLNRYQCRAGRALLDWSQRELAERSSLSAGTIRDFETGRRTPTRANLAAMRRVMEAAGISFWNDVAPGARIHLGPPVELTDAADESPA